MKAKKARKKSTARAKPTTGNPCLSCGTEMRETSGKLSLLINGEEITVPALSHLRCPKCDEVILRLDESRKLKEWALEIYRVKHDLLAGEEIRRIRERLSLTQGQLAELLRLGVNTLSRWESGRNVQTAAMDVLLRMVRDVPGSVEYLQSLAA